jgi:hypothetical protein
VGDDLLRRGARVRVLPGEELIGVDVVAVVPDPHRSSPRARTGPYNRNPDRPLTRRSRDSRGTRVWLGGGSWAAGRTYRRSRSRISAGSSPISRASSTTARRISSRDRPSCCISRARTRARMANRRHEASSPFPPAAGRRGLDPREAARGRHRRGTCPAARRTGGARPAAATVRHRAGTCPRRAPRRGRARRRGAGSPPPIPEAPS